MDRHIPENRRKYEKRYRASYLWKRRIPWRRTYYMQRRLRLKYLSDHLKTRPCADCRGWFETCQMQFDHRDPSTKYLEIGQMVGRGSSLNSFLEEVKKCDVVCANCHILRTVKQRQLGLIRKGCNPLMDPRPLGEFANITA